jgi:hypothetical protein
VAAAVVLAAGALCAGVAGVAAVDTGHTSHDEPAADPVAPALVLSTPPLLPGSYASITSTPVLDTATGLGTRRGPLAAGAALTLHVDDRAGVPAALAGSVALQVRVSASGPGELVLGSAPDHSGSSLRVPYSAGVTSGLVMVPLASPGAIRLANAGPASATVAVDVQGYYLSGAAALPGTFSPAGGVLLDTAAPLGPHASVRVQVAGRAGIPRDGVGAVALQVVAESPTAPGFVNVQGTGYAYHDRQSAGGLVIARLAGDGSVRVANSSAGATGLSVSAVGYFRAGTAMAAGAFQAVAPAGAARVLAAHSAAAIPLAGHGAVPASGVADVLLRVQVSHPSASGGIAVYGRGPSTRLNFAAGQTVAETVLARPGPDGSLELSNLSRGAARVAVEVLGYYLAAPPAAAKPPFPTTVSANHRYLLDQYGRPYLMHGDSPHSAGVRLSESEMVTYLADRHRRGFNTVLVQVIAGKYAGNPRSDLATFDGIAPFLTRGDISTPNPAYFARLKFFVATAESDGIEVMFGPADTGQLVLDSNFLIDNGVTKDRAYGAFLGRTFGGYPNVMWQSGNDFQSSHWAAADPVVTAVSEGIRSTAPHQLQTVELDYPTSTSFDDPPWRSLIDLNAAYTYAPTYAEVLKAYGASKPDPVYMTEASYEYESLFGSPKVPATIRRQAYWSMTSGATGQLYGSHYTWNAAWKDEVAHLDSPGAIQFGYVRALFEQLRWWTLVPDQRHSFVTSGYGAFSNQVGNVLDNAYVSAAYDPAGTVAVAYLPTKRAVQVNLATLHGRVTARWWDPVRGTFSGAGSYPNHGSHSFTPPGGHPDGYSDWVLVLTA